MNKSVSVIGAGTMGAGIAQVFLSANWSVTLLDLNEEALKRASSQIQSNLEKLKSKGKISSEKPIEELMQNLRLVSDLKASSESSIVIEAIVEKLDVKVQLFQSLEAMVPEKTILASNTSALSINAIGEALQRAQNFIGMHFFNPAALMPLVEVIVGRATSEYTKNTALGVAEEIGKKAAVCTDSPGFIVNRVARPFYSESFRLVDLAVAEPLVLDSAIKNLGFKMGPAELSDLIGHDINLEVTKSLYNNFAEAERFRPSRAQTDLVLNNKLGRKTKEGFFQYD